MYAALKTAGTQPVVSERLNSSVKKGARKSVTDLSVGVGSESRAHLLSGSTRTAATTSSMMTGSIEAGEMDIGRLCCEGRRRSTYIS